jgi:hypothetical protein
VNMTTGLIGDDYRNLNQNSLCAELDLAFLVSRDSWS